MRLLIFLLALTSAFFVSGAEPDMSDLKPPKSEPEDLYRYTCSINNKSCPVLEVASGSDEQALQNLADTFLSSLSSGFVEGCSSLGVSSSGGNNYNISALCTYGNNQGEPNEWTATQRSFISVSFIGAGNILSCPPDDFPNYNISVTDSSGSKMCAKEIGDCPAGYHSKAVSYQIGGSECVPKDCPAAGSGEALSSSPRTGGVPFSGGGMYCNDGCAYSVPESNISSQNYASGTSQGVACGDKPYDNKKLAEEGDEGGCKTTTNVDGVSVLTCDKPTEQPKPVDDKPNNDDSKVDDTEKPKNPYEDCAIDDSACMLRNLKTASENSSQESIDNDNKLHNKMVDTLTKNTNALKSSIENLDTTVYLAHQENARNDTIKIQKLSGIIDAINGIETGGNGGGGGGNGGGTGTGEGEGDCAGSATDCVPIGDSEIPVETVNLQQYSDKYDDWLPNAELPEKKCIVLTTGKSLCLSLEAFIIFFKAISGLMVIGALMHSAKIIAGAV